MEFFDKTKSIDLGQENIQTISLGSKKGDVIRTLGKPDSIEKVEDPKSEHLIYDDGKGTVEFQINKDIVTRIYNTSESYQTAKAVSVHSTLQEISLAYGTSYYERLDTGSKVIGYFDKKNGINIEFITHNQVVKGVLITNMVEEIE